MALCTPVCYLDPSRGNGIELTSLDIKPSNVLVNYDPLDGHIADVQLADLESTVHKSTIYATDGDPIGTPIFRSTEAILQMQWGTATDVWSFGTMVWPPLRILSLVLTCC